MPQGQTAAGGEEADAQVAAGGGDLCQHMQGRRFPSLDMPMSSWSEPPRDLLECILDKLKEHRDILLFSSVCAAWRSFILENLQSFPRQLPLSRCLPQRCLLPLLMIPSQDSAKACDFFCIFEHKLYGGTPLPDSNKWIWGSSNGWLVTADICDGSEIYLFNPISRAQIYLPSKTEISRPKCDRNQFGLHTFYYLSKAALSSNPASSIEGCAVMGIISRPCVLSFCRPGDNKWINVADSPKHVDDIIYYKELFYAVNMYGVVVSCDIGPSPKATAVVRGPKVHVDDELADHLLSEKKYLVESRGELLLVVRMVYTDDAFSQHRTVDFQIFKLQERGSEDDGKDEGDEEYEIIDGRSVHVEDRSYKWVKLDNLHDQVIFLGFNQSFSLPASTLPNSKGNCIYFTDDYLEYYSGRLCFDYHREKHADMGVFNLEDGSVHPFHLKGSVFPIPPIWVSPTPWIS